MVFCLQINNRISYNLVLLFLMGAARRAQSTQNDKIVISQKKKGGIKLILCMQINNKLSYKMIPLNLVGMTRPAHNYPKLKVCKTFAISQERSDRP